MIIHKDKVIKALRNEPLKAGFFFHEGKNNKSCNVCAVGAVLRTHINKRLLKNDRTDLEGMCMVITNNDYYDYVDNRTSRLLKEKNYLGALSNEFEAMMDDRIIVTKKVRKDLVEFVKKNFPTKFKVKDPQNILKENIVKEIL